jgi:hypothetical protein
VTGKIGVPVGGAGPDGIPSTRLTPQFIANAQSFSSAQAADPLRPIVVFRLPNGAPVAAEILANATGDHSRIVARRGVDERGKRFHFRESLAFAIRATVTTRCSPGAIFSRVPH